MPWRRPQCTLTRSIGAPQLASAVLDRTAGYSA
jgi:hypothetical protein